MDFELPQIVRTAQKNIPMVEKILPFCEREKIPHHSGHKNSSYGRYLYSTIGGSFFQLSVFNGLVSYGRGFSR